VICVFFQEKSKFISSVHVILIGEQVTNMGNKARGEACALVDVLQQLGAHVLERLLVELHHTVRVNLGALLGRSRRSRLTGIVHRCWHRCQEADSVPTACFSIGRSQVVDRGTSFAVDDVGAQNATPATSEKVEKKGMSVTHSITMVPIDK
jgi:hypothetical protein